MKFKTPNLPLKWTHISGKGSPKYGKDFNSENPLDFVFKATVIVNAEQAKVIRDTMMEFWNANKPAKIMKPTSTFLKEEEADSDELDEYGAPIKKPTGNYTVTASTNTHFRSKDGLVPTKIAILNSKGMPFPSNHKLVLGEVGVGDGSKGVIHGSLAVTEYEGKAYIKFYLKGVQFAKFVPYEGSSLEAEDLGVDSDDGSSVEDDGMLVESLDTSTETQSGPNL